MIIIIVIVTDVFAVYLHSVTLCVAVTKEYGTAISSSAAAELQH